jgi:hypothetical protein
LPLIAVIRSQRLPVMAEPVQLVVLYDPPVTVVTAVTFEVCMSVAWIA